MSLFLILSRQVLLRVDSFSKLLTIIHRHELDPGALPAVKSILFSLLSLTKFSTQLLVSVLRLLQNVVKLTIILPHTWPGSELDLSGIRLPNLRQLVVRNIDHARLRPFLLNNLGLLALLLGSTSCGHESCPLRGILFEKTVEISGAYGCVGGMVAGNRVKTLRVGIYRRKDFLWTGKKLLGKVGFAAYLTTLAIEIERREGDILKVIGNMCKILVELKLGTRMRAPQVNLIFKLHCGEKPEIKSRPEPAPGSLGICHISGRLSLLTYHD